jgi:hypothetical protein
MTEKPKRKNDEPIPRRYWWIFGILTLVMLIGLRFPVRITASFTLNLLLYVLIVLACFLAMIRFIQRFRWKHAVVFLMLICIVLTGLNIRFTFLISDFPPLFEASCTTEHFGIFSTYHCYAEPWCYKWADYIGLRGIPIVVQTNTVISCVLF